MSDLAWVRERVEVWANHAQQHGRVILAADAMNLVIGLLHHAERNEAKPKGPKMIRVLDRSATADEDLIHVFVGYRQSEGISELACGRERRPIDLVLMREAAPLYRHCIRCSWALAREAGFVITEAKAVRDPIVTL